VGLQEYKQKRKILDPSFNCLLLGEKWSTLLVHDQKKGDRRTTMLDLSAFQYSREASLRFAVVSENVRYAIKIQDIRYPSPHGGKVPAYLIFSEQQTPVAGLIFGHWGEGNRQEFVDEASILARLGFVSLCLDAPFRRVEPGPLLADLSAGDLQWIVDVRRGVDLLQERFQLSSSRLGYIGHSYGATLGGVLAGNEHRIKAYILMAGWYSLSEIMRTSNNPMIAQERADTPPEAFNSYLAAMSALDACHYIGSASPSHLFFQFARRDEFIPVEDAERFFALASKPKQIVWYDHCDHELSAQARLDRAIFLCQQLGLAEPSQEILDLLARVPPPLAFEEWGYE
jgi:dienelactone hydrolase